MKALLAALVVAAASLATVVPAPAASARVIAAEKMANPDYVNWSQFKVGTSVTTRVISDAGGQRNEIIKTVKLVELHPDKAILEISGTQKYGDMQMTMATNREEVWSQIDRLAPMAGAPTPRTGSETVQVGGKSYNAQWSETVIESQGVRTTSKEWRVSNFPGQVVKMESRSEGGASARTSSEVTAVKLG